MKKRPWIWIRRAWLWNPTKKYELAKNTATFYHVRKINLRQEQRSTWYIRSELRPYLGDILLELFVLLEDLLEFGLLLQSLLLVVVLTLPRVVSGVTKNKQDLPEKKDDQLSGNYYFRDVLRKKESKEENKDVKLIISKTSCFIWGMRRIYQTCENSRLVRTRGTRTEILNEIKGVRGFRQWFSISSKVRQHCD